MNDQKLDNKIRKDTDRVKKDLTILAEDSAARIGRLEGNVSQATDKAKEGMTSWMAEGVTQMEKMTGDVKDTVVDTAATVKKDIGHGLSQFNAKVQKAANKVPGELGKKAARYPWVSISIALAIGFLLGSVLNSIRPEHGIQV